MQYQIRRRTVLFIIIVTASCSKPPDFAAIGQVGQHLTFPDLPSPTRWQSEPVAGGYVVEYVNENAVFWVLGESVYTVNDKARGLAPDLAPLPADIDPAQILAALPKTKYADEFLVHTGLRLTADEAAKMEEVLAQTPDDLAIRAPLVGYYFFHTDESPGNAEARDRHALWIIEHHPESPVAGAIEMGFDAELDNPNYPRAEALWTKQVGRHPEDTRVLSNAAEFYLIEDPKRAEELLKRCQLLEPDNKEWTERLDFLDELAGVGAESPK